MKKIKLNFASDVINDRFIAEIRLNEEPYTLLSEFEKKRNNVIAMYTSGETAEIDAKEYCHLLQKVIDEL